LLPIKLLDEPYKEFEVPKMILSLPFTCVLLLPTTVVLTPLIIF
jgi:hypothetical protein